MAGDPDLNSWLKLVRERVITGYINNSEIRIESQFP
jgi:hypothetical protein